MTGVITSIPPLVEQPPGSNSSNPAGLPGVTYTAAVPILPQTWTGVQTFNTGTIRLAGSTSGYTFLNATAIASGTVLLPAITGSDTLLSNANTATVTNKSIDGLQNTLTNIPAASFGSTTGTGAVVLNVGPSISGATITTSTFNGNIWTAGTGTLTLGAGKTATISNTLTFTGADASSIAFGAGGTVAYQGGTLAQFAATTSAQLRGVLSDETGTGAAYFQGGDLGTPSAGVLTNATGLPVLGISGFATGVATFLATPSSANLRAALTDEVGTGAAYFVGGALGTPASGTATNLTGLPLSGLTAQGAYTFVGNNSGSSAVPTAVDIALLTTKASPAAGDYVMLSDQAASGAWKKAAVSSLASAGSVASIAGNTGAFTLSGGITNATNDIRLANMTAFSIKGNDTSGSAAPTDISTQWSTFTPTITASSGTITTVTGTGKYIQIGKIVHVIIKAAITTNGTGAGALLSTLPVTASTTQPVAALTGFQQSAGNGVWGRLTGANQVTMATVAAAGYPGSTGETVTISGVYEAN